MTHRRELRVTNRAAAEIRAASSWWAENRPGAPAALREELGRTFELLATHPEIGAVARNPRLVGIRRILLARVRYHLYYRAVTDPPVVEILALWHASRGLPPSL